MLKALRKNSCSFFLSLWLQSSPCSRGLSISPTHFLSSRTTHSLSGSLFPSLFLSLSLSVAFTTHVYTLGKSCYSTFSLSLSLFLSLFFLDIQNTEPTAIALKRARTLQLAKALARVTTTAAATTTTPATTATP